MIALESLPLHLCGTSHRPGSGGTPYHIHPGYPGIQHSGNATSFAPPFAASVMRLTVFCTLPGRSSHSGSACVTATRRTGSDILGEFSDSGHVKSRKRCVVCCYRWGSCIRLLPMHGGIERGYVCTTVILPAFDEPPTASALVEEPLQSRLHRNVSGCRCFSPHDACHSYCR